MDMSAVALRRNTGPRSQSQQLGRPRRLLGDAGEVRGDGVGHVLAPGVLERSAEHPPRRVEQQKPLLCSLEPGEYAGLLERLGRPGGWGWGWRRALGGRGGGREGAGPPPALRGGGGRGGVAPPPPP